MTEPSGREHVFPLPGSMDEMTARQLLFLAGLVEEAVPIQDIKTRMLLRCMGARLLPSRPWDGGCYRLRARRRTFRLSADQLARCASAFDYLFIEQDDGRCYLDTRLTVCPFPSMWLLGRRFCAPDRALYGTVYERYVLLETYFDRMQREPEMALAFLGTLLRPCGERLFDRDRLHLGYMRHVPRRRVVLLAWYFVGSMRFIAGKFPRIFGGGGGAGQGGRPSLYDGQQRLLDFIAKADPDKKARMKHTGLYEVLYSLDYLLEEDERQRKALARMRERQR